MTGLTDTLEQRLLDSTDGEEHGHPETSGVRGHLRSISESMSSTHSTDNKAVRATICAVMICDSCERCGMVPHLDVAGDYLYNIDQTYWS